MSTHLHADPTLAREQDRAPRLPIVLVLVFFSIFLITGISILWVLYQSVLTKIVVNVESQTTYYERDLLRAYEEKILQSQLDKAIQATLRRYAPGNPSTKTAQPPHSGPPDRTYSILAPHSPKGPSP